MTMFYMQYKGREKAAKVVEFVAKWLNLCLSTVLFSALFLLTIFFSPDWIFDTFLSGWPTPPVPFIPVQSCLAKGVEVSRSAFESPLPAVPSDPPPPPPPAVLQTKCFRLRDPAGLPRVRGLSPPAPSTKLWGIFRWALKRLIRIHKGSQLCDVW